VEVDENLRRLILADPRAAADELDRLAERFHQLASELRQRADDGIVSAGGLSERVRAQVVGPDGAIKQEGGVG
jgi:hypothetical protein